MRREPAASGRRWPGPGRRPSDAPRPSARARWPAAPGRRCSRASAPIAASTRATIAAIRAARTHSSVSRTAAQPRSTRPRRRRRRRHATARTRPTPGSTSRPAAAPGPLELEHRPAELASRALAGLGLDLDHRELDGRGQEVDPGREPVERRDASARASVQRPSRYSDSDDVAAQEVAVDGLEPGLPGVLDASIRDLDRLRPAGRPGRAPSSGWRMIRNSSSGRRAPRRHARPRGAARWLPRDRAPAERHAEGRRRVDVLFARRRIARPGDADRLPGQPLGLGEGAVEHQQLGQARRGPAPAPGVALARHELHGAASGLRSRHPDRRPPAGTVGEPVVEQAQPDAIAASVERPRSPPRGRRGARAVGRPRRRPRQRGPGGRALIDDRRPSVRRAAVVPIGRSGTARASSRAASSSAGAYIGGRDSRRRDGCRARQRPGRGHRQ